MSRLAAFESGRNADGDYRSEVAAMLQYRPELFGQPFSEALQDVMRGPSEWSIAERELFAAFVSSLNQCPFWTESHGAVATVAFGSAEVVDAVLTDWRTAPIELSLRAMLGYLEAVTLRPGEVAPADVEAVREAGVSDQAMVDALLVAAYFNLIDRLADSFGFVSISNALGAEGLLEHEAKFLAKGYV